VTGDPAGPARWLRRALIALHLALALSISLALFQIQAAGAIRAGLIGLALLPLALILPRLIGGGTTALSWLALVLVLYAGLGSVEVIATQSLAAAVWFFSALGELGLVVMLNRRPGPGGRGGPEES